MWNIDFIKEHARSPHLAKPRGQMPFGDAELLDDVHKLFTGEPALCVAVRA